MRWGTAKVVDDIINEEIISIRRVNVRIAILYDWQKVLFVTPKIHKPQQVKSSSKWSRSRETWMTMRTTLRWEYLRILESWCRKRMSPRLCLSLCSCHSCRFPRKLPWLIRLTSRDAVRGKKNSRRSLSAKCNEILSLPPFFTALENELFTVCNAIRQRERESVCEIHAEPGDTESGNGICCCCCCFELENQYKCMRRTAQDQI